MASISEFVFCLCFCALRRRTTVQVNQKFVLWGFGWCSVRLTDNRDVVRPRQIRQGPLDKEWNNNRRRIQSSCISTFTFLFPLPSFKLFSVVSVLLLVSLTFASVFLPLCLKPYFLLHPLPFPFSLFHLLVLSFKMLKWEIKEQQSWRLTFHFDYVIFLPSLPSPLYS